MDYSVFTTQEVVSEVIIMIRIKHTTIFHDVATIGVLVFTKHQTC